MRFACFVMGSTLEGVWGGMICWRLNDSAWLVEASTVSSGYFFYRFSEDFGSGWWAEFE